MGMKPFAVLGKKYYLTLAWASSMAQWTTMYDSVLSCVPKRGHFVTMVRHLRLKASLDLEETHGPSEATDVVHLCTQSKD
jgi:hypothetical protein